jgi:hypothetical protein
MSNKQKIADVMTNLDAHNKANNTKMIAKAIAINIVAPIVATVATVAIINHLNKDK